MREPTQVTRAQTKTHIFWGWVMHFMTTEKLTKSQAIRKTVTKQPDIHTDFLKQVNAR